MASHEYTLRLQASPSHVQLACDSTYLALPLGRSSVAIWSLCDVSCKPLELEGHSKRVSALSFGHSASSTLLCSAAEDYVIIWNVEKARASYESGQQIRGKVIGTTLGYIQSLSFSPSVHVVAAGIGREVYILDATQERVDTILDGHDGDVNCVEFCPHYSSTLVSASEDRTYKVWDISEGCMLYQSSIISSSPFISLTMSPIQECFAIGTADGQVRVYDLTDGNGFRCLHHLDINKLSGQLKELPMAAQSSTQPPNILNGPKKISSRPSWQKNGSLKCPQEETEVDRDDEECEVGSSILGMSYVSCVSNDSRAPTPAKLSFLNQQGSVVGDMIENTPVLVIGTTGAVFMVHAKTLEPAAYFCFKEPIPSNSMVEDSDKTISLVGNILFVPSMTSDQIWVVAGGLFQNEVNLLKLNLPTKNCIDVFRQKLALKITSGAEAELNDSDRHDGAANDPSQLHITVLSSTPLQPNSPLKAELVLKKMDSKITKTSQRHEINGAAKQYGALDKKGRIKNDQPLTYHAGVRSSGYSKESSKSTMFQPRTSATSTAKASPFKVKKSVAKEFPLHSTPPTVVKVKLDATDKPTAINTINFSDDGQNVACSLGNNTGQIFKMPLTGKGCAFAGHQGIVTGANWSRDSAYLITSSEDRSARVWSIGLPDPVMTISTENNNFGADKEGGLKPDRDNSLFKRGVRFAQFYYMDKFIILTSGNSFNLYKYHLDTTKSDIKRYLSNNRYKMVKCFEMEKSQQITAFSAVNGFHSYITLCAGTNKSVEIFDMNEGRSVRVIPSAHERQIHCICQMKGSTFVSHSGPTYDLFLTAAASDCIKLWDIRTNRCVCRYEGHCNRTQPCGLAFSPCSRYIATGSEDRSAYIFDIRTGTYIHKLTGHTDTVSDVKFHPLYPQLMTATLDGKLRLFVED